jgi:hypothetical protein
LTVSAGLLLPADSTLVFAYLVIFTDTGGNTYAVFVLFLAIRAGASAGIRIQLAAFGIAGIYRCLRTLAAAPSAVAAAYLLFTVAATLRRSFVSRTIYAVEVPHAIAAACLLFPSWTAG